MAANERYLAKAAECEATATATHDAGARESYLAMAATWRHLAKMEVEAEEAIAVMRLPRLTGVGAERLQQRQR